MAVQKITGMIATKESVTLYDDVGDEITLSAEKYNTKDVVDRIVEPLSKVGSVSIDLDKFLIGASLERKTGGFLRFVRKVGKSMGLTRSEEITAIVGSRQINNVGALSRYIKYAEAHDQPAGLASFMEKLADLDEKRGHTTAELMDFMAKGDLPIAKDGMIIGYKRLRRHGSGEYVDCYTRKIVQKVGSHVSMPEKDVDPSRNTGCSVGLHVAQRGYLASYTGDVIVLVKIDPRDVIAVPRHETTKMRVSAYHIVAEVPHAVERLLLADTSMTKIKEGVDLLTRVVNGDHVGVTEKVWVVNNEVALRKAVNTDKKVDNTKIEVAEEKSFDDDKQQIDPAKIAAAAKQPEKQQPVKKPTEKKIKKELSEKQKKALAMLKEGKSQRAIAKELGMCPKTIRRLIKAHNAE